MSTFDEDEALARLRAADPASGAHPDLHRISQRLRGQTPLDSGSGGFAFSDTSDTAVRVHDPDVRTGRGGILVAAAVAALALGGGGYALGTTAGDDNTPTVAASDSSSDDANSAVTHDSGPALDQGVSAAAEGGAVDMSGDEAMSEEGMGGGGGYAGPVIPVAGEGLSTERTTGTVYGASADSAGPGEELTDLLQGYADRLGIEGTVQDEDGHFAHVIDSADGRNLAAYSNGATSSLDYTNPTLDPWCEDMRTQMADSGEDYGWFGYGSGGPADITCTELGPRPDDATALATAEEFLAQLEVDYSGYTLQVQTYDPEIYGTQEGDGAYATSAPGESHPLGPENTSTEVIVSTTDGPLEGYHDWHLSVTSEGVSYASIQFGDYVELGDYPVISPAEAVERVNDVRFQQLGAYIPTLDYYDESGYYEEWVEPEPLPPIAPGELIPYPLTESAVTTAELHTGIVSLWDGTEFIVPVYDLSDGQGNHWQVMGLAEEALDFTP